MLPEITKRAVTAINRMMETLPQSMNREEYLPIVAWAVESDEPNFVPGPCIGVHPKEGIPAEYIVEAHGVRVAYNIPESRLQKLQDSVLHYMEGRFLFIDKQIAALLDSNGD